MEKQIEKMAWDLCDIPRHPSIKSCEQCGNKHCHSMYYAERAYNAGYREQEWISVEERLPECKDVGESEAVLFLTSEGRVEVGYFGRGSVWHDVYFRHYRTSVGRDASDVTHWMPLPHLPKGE